MSQGHQDYIENHPAYAHLDALFQEEERLLMTLGCGA